MKTAEAFVQKWGFAYDFGEVNRKSEMMADLEEYGNLRYNEGVKDDNKRCSQLVKKYTENYELHDKILKVRELLKK